MFNNQNTTYIYIERERERERERKRENLIVDEQVKIFVCLQMKKVGQRRKQANKKHDNRCYTILVTQRMIG